MAPPPELELKYRAPPIAAELEARPWYLSRYPPTATIGCRSSLFTSGLQVSLRRSPRQIGMSGQAGAVGRGPDGPDPAICLPQRREARKCGDQRDH